MRAQNMVCRMAGGACCRHRNELPLLLDLDSPKSDRRFPLSPSEGERVRERGPFWPWCSESPSASIARGILFRTMEWGAGHFNSVIARFSNPSPQPSPRSSLAGRGSQLARLCRAGKKCTRALLPLFVAVLCLVLGHPSLAQVVNGGFETGGFEGWTADPNWVVVDNSCGFYSGWAGKYWAWSGGKGESATGVLTSKPFKLDKDAVRLLISGWSSIRGTGQPRRWNYVTLNLADGTELDRVYAPDTTAFVPVVLDGSKHRGKTVFIRAVDDADQPTFSMLCIDDVRTMAFPRDYTRPVKPLPSFDAKRSLRLEDKNCSVEVSRANGSITRIRDKKTGLDLLLEPRLAGSYRFALPIPGKEPWQTIEANWVCGKDQKLTAHHLEGNRLTLRWDGPLKNYLREPFDVSVTMTIELRDEGVWFGLKIDNPSRYVVGETYFPVLGGIQGLGTTRGQLQATEMVRPSGAPASGRKRRGTGSAEAAPAPAGPGFTTSAIFKSFNNMSWLGDQGPEQYYAYPESQPEPWVGFSVPKVSRSVLIGVRDPADRSLYVRLELIPASSGTPRDDGNWPRPSELRGAPVGVELSFVDVKGGPIGTSYEAAPVFLRFLDGGAAEMMRDYAAWPP